jgi:hypothetical protein
MTLLNLGETDQRFFVDVFHVLSRVLTSSPFFAVLFERYFDLFLNRIDLQSDILRVMVVLVQSNPDFELTESRWKCLTSFVSPSDYVALLQLIAGSNAISVTELFLIRRHAFIPLLLFALGRDSAKTDSFLSFCMRLTTVSNANLSALHSGEVDSLLLTALARGNCVSYRNSIAIPESQQSLQSDQQYENYSEPRTE